MLKLDPKNTELLAQKQKVLNESIKATEEDIKLLEEAQKKYIESGKELNTPAYRNLQREIIIAKNKLVDLKKEASNWTKAGDALIKWGEKLDKVSKKISDLGNKLTTSLTLPITAVATAGLTYDAQIEKYETAFKTFLGSAEEAGKAIKNIKDDAKKTPFDTTSLVKANQMLISTGVSADDAREDILALGEAVVATGGGNDELVRMSSNLQQIKNAGKATAMDIRQFAYAGIDVYGILADYMGKTTEEIKDMEISYDDLTKALKKASSKGGKYFGAMENSSKTLTGQVSALKSEVQDMTGDLVKSLTPTAKKVIEQSRELIKKFDNLSDAQKENIVKIGLLVAAAGPALKLASSGITIIGNVSKGVGTFSKAISLAHNGIGDATSSAATLAKVLQALVSPAGLVTTAIMATGAALVYFALKETDAQKEAKEFAKEMSDSKKSLEEYMKSIDETTNANYSHINSVSKLKDELSYLVDENGKVKDGYKSRVDFILKELNNALGTEYSLNGNIIQNYKDMQEEIQNVIEKRKAEIKLNADEEKYRNAIENQQKAVELLREAHDKLGMSYDDAKKKLEELNVEYDKYIKYDTAKHNSAILNAMNAREIQKEIDALNNLISAYDDAEWKVKTYTENVKAYTNNYEKFVEGKYDEIGDIVVNSTEDWSKKTLQEVKDFINEQGKNLEIYKEIYERTGNDIALQLTQEAKNNLENLAKELNQRTNTIKELGQDEIEAWKNMANSSYEAYSYEISQMAPDMQKKIQEATGIIAGGTPQMQNAAEKLGRKTVEEFDKSADAKQKAINIMSSYLKGLTDEEKRELLKQAGIEDANLVLKELNKGNVSEENGKNILIGLWNGLKNGTLRGKIIGTASGLANAVNNAFTGKSGWDEHSPSKKMEQFAEYYVQPISEVIKTKTKSIMETAKKLANSVNSVFNNSGIPNYENIQSKLKNNVMASTKTVFTTPQIVFNVQELDEKKLQQCFNYINKKFGSQY